MGRHLKMNKKLTDILRRIQEIVEDYFLYET